MRASPTRRASAQDREREPQVRFLEADVDHGLAAASGISPRHVRQLMQALADPSLDTCGGGSGGGRDGYGGGERRYSDVGGGERARDSGARDSGARGAHLGPAEFARLGALLGGAASPDEEAWANPNPNPYPNPNPSPNRSPSPSPNPNPKPEP